MQLDQHTMNKTITLHWLDSIYICMGLHKQAPTGVVSCVAWFDLSSGLCGQGQTVLLVTVSDVGFVSQNIIIIITGPGKVGTQDFTK